MELSRGQRDPPCSGQRLVCVALSQLSRPLQVVVPIDRFALRHPSDPHGSGNKSQYIHFVSLLPFFCVGIRFDLISTSRLFTLALETDSFDRRGSVYKVAQNGLESKPS